MIPVKNVTDRIKISREAAHVIRTHASPGVGLHNVGIHSFNMVTMLLIVYPEASRNLILACVQHDLPERITGDMPHPAKRMGLQNNDLQSNIEYEFNIQVFGKDYAGCLTVEELQWLHGLDMLEFYCWCRDEFMRGHRAIETKLSAVKDYMKKYAHKYPVEIIDLYYELECHNWLQMPDKGDEE